MRYIEELVPVAFQAGDFEEDGSGGQCAFGGRLLGNRGIASQLFGGHQYILRGLGFPIFMSVISSPQTHVTLIFIGFGEN